MKKNKTVKVVSLLVIGIALIISLYPVVWLVLSSFKSTQEFSLYPTYSLPKSFHIENYIEAWTSGNMGVYFRNSILCTLGSLILIILIALPVSFALTKMVWKGKKFFNSYFMMGLMIPIQVSLIPVFQIYKGAGLLNSRLGLVLVYTVFGLPMTILMFTGFFESFPNEMLEAAVIDGCSPMALYWRIVFPLTKGTMFTIVCLEVLKYWNNYLMTQFILTKPQLRTIQIAMMSLFNEALFSWDVAVAAVTLSILPLFVFFVISQKQVMSGATVGAVKG